MRPNCARGSTLARRCHDWMDPSRWPDAWPRRCRDGRSSSRSSASSPSERGTQPSFTPLLPGGRELRRAIAQDREQGDPLLSLGCGERDALSARGAWTSTIPAPRSIAPAILIRCRASPARCGAKSGRGPRRRIPAQEHRPHDQDDGARALHHVAAGAKRFLHR
jgi:hypothetical protein